MRSDHSALQNVVLIRNVANRLKQKAGVLNERNQSAKRQHRVRRRVVHHAISAIPNDQRDSDSADEINQRKKYGVIKNCVDVCVAMFVVNTLKALNGFRFGIKDLNRLRAGKMFLKKSVNSGDARANKVVTTARVSAKPRC